MQSTVDGHSQADNIAQLFAQKYEDLYTCVGYNESDMKDRTKGIDIQIMHDGCDDNRIISLKDIIDVVSRLRPDEYDGHLGLSSDHVRHAGDELYVHFSMLMSAVIVHGCVTENVSTSTVLPISKGKNLIYSDSYNYRGIALSSIHGKMLDAYVINRYNSIVV